jgi:hypothetical protein
MKAAEVLDAQGEVILAGEVRYFAMRLPPVLTDRQRFAAQFIRFKEHQRRVKLEGPERGNPKDVRGTPKVQERTL